MSEAQLSLPLLAVVPKPAEFVPDANVVRVLEEWLECARRGEITALAVAAIRYDNSAQNNFGGYNQIALLGAVDLLKARMRENLRR